MLTEYIQAAMRRAKYELLEENEGFVGTIDECPGLLGHGETLEGCREDLIGALEAWLLVGLWHHQELPVIDGMSLNVVPVAGDEAA
jgi:predicted RNase H-like HicB family nuclease